MRQQDERKVIALTGVSRGLGRALAVELIKRGHLIHGCARSERMIFELRRLYPKQHFYVVDICNDHEVQSWAANVRRNAPHAPDILINNAAVLPPRGVLWCTTCSDVSRVVRTNLEGSIHAIRHFAPSMIARGSGLILNFASRWARTCEPGIASYCSTKAAIVAMTRALARELSQSGVAAVAINPGIVKTSMLKQYLSGPAAHTTETPLTPREWATMAAPAILRLGANRNGHFMRIPCPRLTRRVLRGSH